jgi:hypothetical protein
MADEFTTKHFGLYLGFENQSTYHYGARRPEDVPTHERKTHVVILDSLDGMAATDLLGWAKDVLAKVPKAHREVAKFSYDPGYSEDSTASLAIEWDEPRPQEEIDADVDRARKWQEREAAHKERWQRQQYEALKAKFEREA